MRPPDHEKSALGSTQAALLAEGPCMYSWLYRNRARLGVIYGMSSPAPLALEASPGAGSLEGCRAPAGLPPGAGSVLRRQRYVLLKPMPRRTA